MVEAEIERRQQEQQDVLLTKPKSLFRPSEEEEESLFSFQGEAEEIMKNLNQRSRPSAEEEIMRQIQSQPLRAEEELQRQVRNQIQPQRTVQSQQRRALQSQRRTPQSQRRTTQSLLPGNEFQRQTVTRNQMQNDQQYLQRQPFFQREAKKQVNQVQQEQVRRMRQNLDTQMQFSSQNRMSTQPPVTTRQTSTPQRSNIITPMNNSFTPSVRNVVNSNPSEFSPRAVNAYTLS